MAVIRGLRIRLGGRFVARLSFSRSLRYLVMIGLVCFTALPLIYVISTAFKPIDEILLFPPRFLVRRPTMDNFSDLVVALGSSSVPFLRYVFNSLVVTAVIVGGTVLVSATGAFALTKHKVLLGNFWYMTVIAALMFPAQVTQIPSYLVINGLQMVNTLWALILPKIAVAFNLFLMKQFCEQLPDPLLEAARLDGAGEYRIFFTIVMPYLRPAWATLIVFSFVSSWNDYFSPLVYITSQTLKTLPLALQSIGEAGNIARAGAVAATTFLMTMPTVVLFTLMQRRVIETMAHSGIK